MFTYPISQISFENDEYGRLHLRGLLSPTTDFDGGPLYTSYITQIRYSEQEYAEIYTDEAIYTVTGKDWTLVRFLYDSGAYRDKCTWELF